jgi:hypothetical protein
MPRVAYVVCSHRHPAQVARLVGVLRAESPGCLVVIHHDPTGPPLPDELFGERVVACPDPVAVTWAHWSLAEAILRPLGWLVEHAEFDWAVVISGQDYPVTPLERVERDLAESDADALMLHAPLDEAWPGNEGRLRYLSKVTVMPHVPGVRRFPAVLRRLVRGAGFALGRLDSRLWFRSVQPMGRVVVGHRVRRLPLAPEAFHGSSEWFSVNRRAAALLVERAREQGPLVRHMRTTFSPSEAFFATVLVNEPGFRVDPHNRRYIVFEPGSAHPSDLTVADVEAAAAAGAHFARKFDLAAGSEPLDLADGLRTARASTSG